MTFKERGGELCLSKGRWCESAWAGMGNCRLVVWLGEGEVCVVRAEGVGGEALVVDGPTKLVRFAGASDAWVAEDLSLILWTQNLKELKEGDSLTRSLF